MTNWIEVSNKPKVENYDPIYNPYHYCRGKVKCIDAIASATTGLQGMEAVCTANALKYIWRWKFKDGIKDLKKAKEYIDKLILEVENGNPVKCDNGCKCRD